MTASLLAQVRRKLNITWSDDDTNERVTDIIENAIPIVKRKLGIADNVEFDFAARGEENSLFLNYCLYEYNHIANEFDDNYSNNIAQVRAKNEVKYYEESVAAENE